MKDIDRFDEDVKMNVTDQLRVEKQKRKRAKMKQALIFIAKLFIYHLVVLVLYSLFINRFIATEIYHESGLEPTILLIFSLFTTALFGVIAALELAGDGPRRRAFSHYLSEHTFTPLLPFTFDSPNLLLYGVCYLIFQLPFVLFHLLLGFYYAAPTAIEKFYSMDAGLMEWTHVGFVGAILNTLLFVLVLTLVRYAIYRRWNKEKI